MNKYVPKIILEETEYDKGYQEGRAEAINECLSLVEHALKDTSNTRYDWCVLWRKLWREFEQLKEKKQ